MTDPTLKTIKGDDHTHQVKKVFSPVGISFKGSGFYRNDSASSKKSSPNTATSDSSSSGTETASPAASESKPKKDSTSASKQKTSDAKAAST